jgi:crotonobetainyl-CoA:carnitine CoA-transferase CaiB-like acyl-CoA transferase
MERENLITPEYGPLHGLRVLASGIATAGPFTARCLGDLGAEVIKIETPGVGDSARMGVRHSSGIVPKWDSLDRNCMSLELNLNFDKYPEAKEVFVDLCSQCDIWVNSIPNIGKHGATDELALQVNPRLIINHITGFGLPQNGGDPAYLGRACLDPVGQAFSGLAAMNGMPDGPYITANPLINDAVTAAMSVIGILTAHYNMLKTGKGQVVDTSMFESAAYMMTFHWANQLNAAGNYKRNGPLGFLFPFGYYEAGDGEWISIGVFGVNMWKKFTKLMNVTEEEFPYEVTCNKTDPERVAALDKIWQAWLKERTAEQAEKELAAAGLSASVIMKADGAVKHPHWNARGDFIKLKDQTNGVEITDFATAPKFCGTPIDYGQYKAAPVLGQHTDEILSKILGYSVEKIDELKNTGAVAASMISK